MQRCLVVLGAVEEVVTEGVKFLATGTVGSLEVGGDDWEAELALEKRPEDIVGEPCCLLET